MKKRVCDICGRDYFITGYKVKSDTGGWYKQIDLCRACFNVIDTALKAKYKGLKIEHNLYGDAIVHTGIIQGIREEGEA